MYTVFNAYNHPEFNIGDYTLTPTPPPTPTAKTETKTYRVCQNATH